jgi:hypothetical protein
MTPDRPMSKWRCRTCGEFLVDVLDPDGSISPACPACDGPFVLTNTVRQIFERSKPS